MNTEICANCEYVLGEKILYCSLKNDSLVITFNQPPEDCPYHLEQTIYFESEEEQ